MKKLELYYFPSCPYCQIVLNEIKKHNLDSKIVFKNIREDSKSREKLIEDTGRGTVPCLYIDGEPMHESADIAKWLKTNAKDL